MIVPPTRVLSAAPAVGWGSATTPKTTPGFDVQAGDLMVYMAFTEDKSRAINAPTWTGSGALTLRQSVAVNNYCTAYLYTCDVTATASARTVSTSSQNSGVYSFVISLWRNHGGLGITGKANVSNAAPALSLTGQATSAMVVGSADWNAVDGSTRVWRTVNGAPMTEESYGGQSGIYYVYTGYSPNVGSAGAKTLGLSAPTGQKYSIVGAEILGKEATATALPVTYVSNNVVHTAELFYWDGSARHDLNYAKQI